MAMASPDRREYILTSSGTNPSLAATTQWVSALMTAIILEAITERSPWAVGKLLTGLVGLQPISSRKKKTFMTARTGQAAMESDLN